MNIVGRVSVNMAPVNAILKRKGLDANGRVQLKFTNIVNLRITRYMPYRAGVLSSKLKFVKSPTEIEVLGPYARMMYYGKVMVDPVTGAAGFQDKDGNWKSRTKAPHVPKVESDRDINYSKHKHALAGPHWDRKMMANEKDQIIGEVQDYIDGRKK